MIHGDNYLKANVRSSIPRICARPFSFFERSIRTLLHCGTRKPRMLQTCAKLGTALEGSKGNQSQGDEPYFYLCSCSFLIKPLLSSSATKLVSTNSSGLWLRISGRRAAAIS